MRIGMLLRNRRQPSLTRRRRRRRDEDTARDEGRSVSEGMKVSQT
jgi:hypothetical protein